MERDDGLAMGAWLHPTLWKRGTGRKSRPTLRSRPGGGLSGRWMTPSQAPPHRRLWGPLGEGGALCHGRVKHGRSCRTFSTLQYHLPGGAPATDLQLHRWNLGCGNLVRDETVPALGACHPKGDAPQALQRGATWAGWGSIPVVFFLGVAGHPCPTLRAISLSVPGEPAYTGKG